MGRSELPHVGRSHPREPVEPLRVPWREPHQRCRPGHPTGQERGAGESVRGSAGAARHREPVQVERVRHGGHVLHGVHDPATGAAVRTSVAGTVEADEPGAALVEEHRAGARPDAAAGHAVQQEHRVAFGVPRGLHAQPATARRPYLIRHRRVPLPCPRPGPRAQNLPAAPGDETDTRASRTAVGHPGAGSSAATAALRRTARRPPPGAGRPRGHPGGPRRPPPGSGADATPAVRVEAALAASLIQPSY